jgi:clan AA aspartic protease (TIGR02281 family)
MKSIIGVLFLLVLFVSSGISRAETYKCVDHEGKVTYSSSPCAKDAQIMHFHDDHAISEGKLAVHMDAAHSYRTPGKVNGRPVNVIIDTGASRTSISQQVADDAGIKGCANQSLTATANGVVANCLATASEITFGTFHIRNLTVSVMPALPVDALLGMDVLGRMRIQQEDGVMYISNH